MESSYQPGYQPALTYISMVLAAIGLVGNMANLRSVLAARMKELSISLFIAAVAVSDSIVLIFIFLHQLSQGILNKRRDAVIYGTHDWGCRFGVFLESMCKIMSSWLVVAMMAECYIRKCQPEKEPYVCTRERAFVVNLSVVFISFAGCFPVLVIATSDGYGMCSSRYRTFYKLYVDVILNSITTYLIPVIILVFCFIITSVKMCKTKSTITTDDLAEKSEIKRSHPEEIHITRLVLSISGLHMFSCVPFLASEIVRHLITFSPQSVGLDTYNVNVMMDILQFLLIFTYGGKVFVGLAVNKHWRKNVFQVCHFGQMGRPYVYHSGSYAETNGQAMRERRKSTVKSNGVHMNGATPVSNPIDETIFSDITYK